MTKINNHLNSIGKEIFITYYNDLKNFNLNKEELAVRMCNENPDAHSLKAQIIRINLSRKLFERNEHIEALRIIVASIKLPKWVVVKASELLKDEIVEA
ncbi:hypothetical protein [Paenibacillus sp. sgz500992]|uniref:hypothetical protein n=1 Tax=Paenibacillus sp. sgz500992 TaxID=3242476 RepID=UPI0036D3C2E6